MRSNEECASLGDGASVRTDCPVDCTSEGINNECNPECTQGTVVDETNHGPCEAMGGMVGQCFFSWCINPVECTDVNDCVRRNMRIIMPQIGPPPEVENAR